MSAAQSEIDTLIGAFYAAFDNRGGHAPRIAALRAMFAPDARVTRVSAEGVASWSVDQFIAPREAMLTDGTLTEFREWETQAETQMLDRIASRRSAYRKSGTLNGAAYGGEGRKFIQLCRTEGGWRIVSVLWEDL